MTEPTPGRLRVPGATLHYEVRGHGPLLLLIPGGSGGAAAFDGVADALAPAYTVATYDPRGLSRSPLDDDGAEQRVPEHADDALRLIDELSPGEPARVFGSSSGAITALHLLTAHPHRVERVVAHEPPVVELLLDAAAHRGFIDRVQGTLRTQGLLPALAVFAAGLKKDGDPTEPQPAAERPRLPSHAAARAERTMADLPYFIGRIVPGFMLHHPDLPRLRALSDRLAVACGQDSDGELPHRAATFLAERVGAELLRFPGGHTGLTTHPVEFGELLKKALHASRGGASR
ncbi:alpha/beta hydrolase [Streptomyces gulbargensis]|uniref:Alpha/beta hydrolase n=1 Tax=Streptomyces gulbargensis TaxID=364901 RepID=A0ABP7MC32_9ACTN